VSDDADLIRLELENQIAGNRAFIAGDAVIGERYGTSFATVAGLSCSSCAVWDYPLFNRVIGAGVLAPLDDGGLAQIVAHYASTGRAVNVEVYEGITPPAVLAVLDRAGFVSAGHGLEAHVLETDHEVAPRATQTQATTVRKVAPDEYTHFGELVRDGFDMRDDAKLGQFFVDLTVASLRVLGGSSAAFIASVDGQDAGTGQLVLSALVAGCYSGSVLKAFRGRGIQHALIAARVRDGLARGKRIFISQTGWFTRPLS